MTGSTRTVYSRDFWVDENTKYTQPHHRMRKVARVVNRLAAGRECKLLDLGCGPATLGHLLAPNIRYFGMDIAVQVPAPNLKECDILEAPISSDEAPFDLIVAQGLFEYLSDRQAQKFAEIARLLRVGGKFIVSYVNFDRRRPDYHPLYSNIQPSAQFRHTLGEKFVVERQLPTAHNWHHSEPRRWYLQRSNMHVNVNMPLVTKWLGVEYLYVCRPRAQN